MAGDKEWTAAATGRGLMLPPNRMKTKEGGIRCGM